MKKVFLIAAAVVALAACSKNEVLPSSSINNEISFNVAPRTKADPETFDTHNVFASWAYYLPNGSTWDKPNGVTPQEYIVNSTVSHQTATNTWKCTDKTYYWPKDDGKLTFFAYSLNRGNLTLIGGDSHITCDATSGIHGTIDLKENPNTDFMVAEIAKDKTANESAHSFNGVPTLFKHKLSKVACNVVKAANYENVKFELNKIEFLNVSHFVTYTQITKNGENFLPGKKDTMVYTSENQEIISTPSPVAKEDVVIYIPQKFTEETDPKKTSKIKVTYTITTTVEGITPGSTTEVVQTVEREYLIKDKFAEWEMGKKYIFNLTFSLDEIRWAPAVEPWVDAPAGDIDVK